eukprot:TRINITY_DN21805_c0_g1_i1.p1 TRINITY_DN21805_c0_g1~~TRINITY_DN21805_c0_g1_i1.p1  ORF type:complete len:434 (-),score=66.75 TRINITY_DN21805_c0_g1_i1:50-1294(-)
MGLCGLSGRRKEYNGGIAIRGYFSARDAQRLGFYSKLNPPHTGDFVVCYHKDNWLRSGVVTTVREHTKSTGVAGLKRGHEGTLVEVHDKEQDSSFTSWAAFLAPAQYTQRSYSSICSDDDFRASHFCNLYVCENKDGSNRVSLTDARSSLKAWMQNAINAAGEPLSIPAEIQEQVLDMFDHHEDPSLYLYTTHTSFTKQKSKFSDESTTAGKGMDYSLYYAALNNTLNHDCILAMQSAMPLISRMVYVILYDDATGQRRLHPRAELYKGDSRMPDASTMRQLRHAQTHGEPIRFRQFLSTTSSRRIADKFRMRDDKPGFEWIIEVAEGFWGARDIQDVSRVRWEMETLFPPYSAFRVAELEAQRCRLVAVDRGEDSAWQECQAVEAEVRDPAWQRMHATCGQFVDDSQQTILSL